VTTFVGVMSEVARRELAAHRSLALGVVTESFTNEGGKGEHHLDCHVRLHGSELVLQHVPVAVARAGLSAVPRKDDLVVVGFLDGDVNGPVLLGTLHADGVPSPDARKDDVVYEVPDEGGSARRIELKLPNGNTLTVKDDEVSISMGGTTVVVESGGAITLEASGDITISANGNLKLEAQANLDIKAGANATVEASANATLKGAMTSIAGMTSFKAG
jgi:uncharacterized protein involved in type VI secretion and phage assembly